MKKGKILLATNILLALVVLYQAISGVIMVFEKFPAFVKLHGPTGIALIVLIITHIILNWSWVRANIVGKKKKQGSTE